MRRLNDLSKHNSVEEGIATPRIRPIYNPEVREQQMIGHAIDLAEKQLIDGTASAAVITHYLRLGTEKAKLERVKLEKEITLIASKADSITTAADNEGLAKQVLDSMKSYGMLHE